MVKRAEKQWTERHGETRAVPSDVRVGLEVPPATHNARAAALLTPALWSPALLEDAAARSLARGRQDVLHPEREALREVLLLE